MKILLPSLSWSFKRGSMRILGGNILYDLLQNFQNNCHKTMILYYIKLIINSTKMIFVDKLCFSNTPKS